MNETKEELEARLHHGTGKGRKTVSGLIGTDFCGFQSIEALFEEAGTTTYWMTVPYFARETDSPSAARERLQRRDQALVAALFLTGSRIQELLMLQSKHFAFRQYKGEDFFVVGGPLLKGHTKKTRVVETVDEKPAKKEGETWRWNQSDDVFERIETMITPVVQNRQPFPIPLWEPMAKWLFDYSQEEERDWLFPTPMKPTRTETRGVEARLKRFGRERRAWISPSRAWNIIKDLGVRTGLRPFPHWFRSQRGRQLHRDYMFEANMLNRWYSWKPRARSTADHYINPGLYNMMDQMIKFKQSHIDNVAEDLTQPVQRIL